MQIDNLSSRTESPIHTPMPSVESSGQIDIHRAVNVALRFFSKAFSGQPIKNAELEEIDRSEDGKFWLVTVGYDLPISDDLNAVREKLRRLGAGLKPRPVRKYRVVKVDAATGQPVNVKIRTGLWEG